MKHKIRLTESQLHNIIGESVKQVLMELKGNTAVNAHKKAQSDIDDYEWGDDNDHDKYLRRQRQSDTFAEYAQNKGMEYNPYGFIGWYLDDSDGVFDRSEVVYGEKIDDVPDLGYGIYALTREGYNTYCEWCDDAAVGYDLGNGRMKGLAGEIGGTQQAIWNYLTSDSRLSKKVQ